MAPTKSELIESAQRFVQKGQLDKAVRDYLQVLQVDPADIQTRLRLGDVYARKGSKADAIQQYLQVAGKHAAAGFYLKAIAVHKQILKLDPGVIESSAHLAELYHKQGLLSDALAQYQVVAAHHDRKGEVREALDTLTKMADLDPQNVGIRLKLADLYFKAQIKESGIEQLLRAAELLGRAGRREEQLTVLERVAAAQPANPGATRTMINLLLEAGHLGPALARLKTAVARWPNDAELRELEADVLLEAGDPARAADALRMLVEAHPDRLALRARLLGLLLDAGDAAALEAELAAFEPARLGPTQVGEAVTVLKTLAAREPPPPADLVALVEERIAVLLAGGGAAVPSGAARPVEAPLDAWASPGTEVPLDAAPSPVASPGAEPELTIELDDDIDVSLDPPAESDASGEALGYGEIDLGATLTETGTWADGAAGDAAPLEGRGRTLDTAMPAGDLLSIDHAPLSPERMVLAEQDPELALDQIPEELEEAEFFVQQGLFDAARAIYQRILAVDPEHPQAHARLAALGKAAGTAQAAPAGRPAPGAPEATGAGWLDLDSLLSEPSGGDEAGGRLSDPEEQVSFEEVFREFKKGVERQVGDDAETHYNLGIAYKEMGLVEDAIVEFERALADPRRTFDCYTMLGLSHLAHGDADAAIVAFQQGLDHAPLDPVQAAALRYELGLAFEAAGRLEEALDAFAAVAAVDPEYRDVTARLERLGGGAPGGEGDERLVEALGPHTPLDVGPQPSPSRSARSKRDKISFL